MRWTLAALTASAAVVFVAVGLGATRAADHALAYAALSNATCGLVAVSRLPSTPLSAEVDFPLLGLLAAALAYRRRRQGVDWRPVLWLLVALLLATGVEFAGKHLVAAPTPSQVFGPVSNREDCGGEGYGLAVIATPFSFPSGSVLRLAFVCALGVALLRPRGLGVALAVASVPIAASRVPIGWHWPSDLIGGFVVGTLAACAALAAMGASATEPAQAAEKQAPFRAAAMAEAGSRGSPRAP